MAYSRILTTFVIFYTFILDLFGQTIVQDLENYKKTYQDNQVITETIKSFSYTGKTLIMTNNAMSFSVGDFITIIINDAPIAKAIVAKFFPQEKLTGLKLVTIYDMNTWKMVDVGQVISLARGDDSYLLKPKKELAKAESKDGEAGGKILSEEDLFDTSTETANDLETNAKRIIKNDNLLGACYGMISLIDANSKRKMYEQLCAHWSYQPFDNIWGEVFFGHTKLKDFPSPSIDTVAQNIVARVKYTFAMPMVILVQPYLGLQYLHANSPGAGKSSNGITLTTEESKREMQLVSSLDKKNIAIGATLFVRSVPGWFFTMDVGTDIINAGVVIEF